MLGFLDWFQARFFFSLGSRPGSRAISPLITLRTLEKGHMRASTKDRTYGTLKCIEHSTV